MAFFKDYGQINYSQILDYDSSFAAVQSIIGICSFPIVEENLGRESTTLLGYEKGFWSKKLKAYVQMELITDAHLDFKLIELEGLEVIPERAEMLIGISVESDFEKFTVPGITKPFTMGKPRKQLLSYGRIMQIIDSQDNIYSELKLAELRLHTPAERFASGIIGPTSREVLIQQELDDIRKAEAKLSFFKKFII